LSFVEDPTRIVRAIRFEQRFGFRIGKQAAALVRNAVRMGLIQKLGGRRIFHELQLILMEDDPSPALRRMAEFGVLPVISPKMRFDQKMEELFQRLKELLSWYQLSFLEEPLERWPVYVLGLFYGQSREELEELWERLQLPANQQERLLWTYEKVEELLRGFFQLPDHRPSDIYRALQPLRPEELLYMMARAQKKAITRAISHYFHRYRHVTTEIRGKDLKALGVLPGRIYKTMLEELLDARLNGEVRNRQEEVSFLRGRFPEYVDQSQNGIVVCETTTPDVDAGNV
jgi:tRNA nucleotidyltransferase (CCA-adding enzyme)